VIGQLTAEGWIDMKRTRELQAEAKGMSVTFHRAFDVSRDPYASLETLVKLGVDRVLTSGQAPSVLDGSEVIAELVRRASGRIGILPGGGITPANLKRVIKETGVSEVHLVGWSPQESGMRYRNTQVFMGGELRPPEFTRWVTDAAVVTRICADATAAGH
jgi:copper homeostasis protein